MTAAGPAACCKDIDKDTVPFRLNFDDTLKEPDVLPGRFPNLLVNGASGIAVGLATNIPPHNLRREPSTRVIAQIDNPDITAGRADAAHPRPGLSHRRHPAQHAASCGPPMKRAAASCSCGPRSTSRTEPRAGS